MDIAKLKKKTRKNDIVKYLDYQIPVIQLKGPKGRVMGVRVGVANFFWVNRSVLTRLIHAVKFFYRA